jgi:phosphopantothenoylcysteine decarboxylase/phosphopantothenate--cysteine ligase
VRRIDVVTAREMLAALKQHFSACDALYMAAAVADWRPKRVLSGKWRAKDGGTQTTSLELVRNPDLLATVARAKLRGKARTVIGFALESGAGEARARAKLRRKNLDFVVLNGPAALNATRTSVIIHGADGTRVALMNRTKEAVARALVGLVARPVRAAVRSRRTKAERAAR